jgi:hypothetical protein
MCGTGLADFRLGRETDEDRDGFGDEAGELRNISFNTLKRQDECFVE